jgi:CubicO group peptidase (beta-lactamase class C family)
VSARIELFTLHRIQYINTGYILPAEIVVRVAKQPYPEWMQENVFGPLGMTSTFSNVSKDDSMRIVKNRAHSYSPTYDKGFNTLVSGLVITDTPGAWLIWTTVQIFGRHTHF